MHLTLSRSDELIDTFPECPENVTPVFDFLPMKDKSSFTLVKDDDSFLQGVWNEPDGVYFESHDADSDIFSSSAHCVSLSVAKDITEAYRNLDPEWRRFCEWVDHGSQEPLENDPLGWIGHFDVLTMHQVLAVLERNEIPCGATPDQGSFLVQVPPEHDAKARRIIDEIFFA